MAGRAQWDGIKLFRWMRFFSGHRLLGTERRTANSGGQNRRRYPFELLKRFLNFFFHFSWLWLTLQCCFAARILGFKSHPFILRKCDAPDGMFLSCIFGKRRQTLESDWADYVFLMFKWTSQIFYHVILTMCHCPLVSCNALWCLTPAKASLNSSFFFFPFFFCGFSEWEQSLLTLVTTQLLSYLPPTYSQRKLIGHGIL